MALSRMVYGDDDWCHAKSLLMLAKAYHEHGGENKLNYYTSLVIIHKLYYTFQGFIFVEGCVVRKDLI